LKTILAFDKSTHPVSPSAGAYHYIAAGVFTHPRPEAVPRKYVKEKTARV